MTWEEQKSLNVGRTKKGSRAAEASGSLFCSSHILRTMSYCVRIIEQTTAKSYLFVLYNKNSLFFIHPNIWKFEKVEIFQISRVHEIRECHWIRFCVTYNFVRLSSNRSWLSTNESA